MPDAEERFDGAVGALRIGDTVRKPAGPWTTTVQAMLRHVHDAGFHELPEPLGIDGVGRETMSFIPGDAASRPWPKRLLTLEGVADLARWTRRFHEANVGFRPQSPVWRAGAMKIGQGEIALHGDLGPWNSIWQGDRLMGVIDWDLAEPGPPIVDVAFLALQVVPLRDDAYAAAAGLLDEVPRAERLSMLCSAYGALTPAEVLECVAWIHERDLAREREWGPLGREPWATFHANGDERIILADRAWLDENATSLCSAG